VIKSFRCADTQKLFETGKSRRWVAIKSVATRKLTQLEAAATLDFLRSPPGNRLESLHGDRAGQHSIRINDQWRVCFVWRDGDVYNVEIVDYHWCLWAMIKNGMRPVHPGEILLEDYLKPLGMTANALAAALRQRVSMTLCVKSGALPQIPRCGWRAILAVTRRAG